jgi:hypothetical protein
VSAAAALSFAVTGARSASSVVMPDFELRYTGTCEQAPPSQIPQLVTLTARRLPDSRRGDA